MQRTSFMRQEGENTAYPNAIGDDRTQYRASANMTDETRFAGANAARSSIKDLLSLYQSLLFAFKHQSEHDTNSTEGSPFKHVRSILSPYIGVGSSKIDDVAYFLGLYRTRLPNNLGICSMNNLLLVPKRMPRIGSSSPGLEVNHHTGNVPGYLASALLIPFTESAVVVLTNSLPFVDPTDFVGQLHRIFLGNNHRKIWSNSVNLADPLALPLTKLSLFNLRSTRPLYPLDFGLRHTRATTSMQPVTLFSLSPNEGRVF